MSSLKLRMCLLITSPFPSPKSQVSHIRMQRTGAVYHEEAEERRYTVTYEGGMDADGPTDPVTLELPVLYVVWPCDKPFPADMDYEVLYDVFLPQAPTASQKAQGLSAEALHVLESMAIDTIRHTGDIGRYPSGTISCYDTHIKDYVPLTHLKLRFSLGSNIYETTTDYNGHFAFKDLIFDNAVMSFVFQDKWKITPENSTTPIVETKGTYKNLRGSSVRDFNIRINSSSVPDPRYEIHRAVAYYYYGITTQYGSSSLVHDHYIPVYVTSSGLRIEAYTSALKDAQAKFIYNIFNKFYIIVGNENRDSNPGLMGSIWHELGHYTHYGLRGGYSKYSAVHKLLRESWGTYAGWQMGESYYSAMKLGAVPFGSDITGQARQDWQYFMAKPYCYYSPLFVDLRDDYNQFNYLYGENTGLYPHDVIKNVPYSILKEIATNAEDWVTVKKILRTYISQGYYTEAQLGYLLADWDEFFARNPS